MHLAESYNCQKRRLFKLRLSSLIKYKNISRRLNIFGQESFFLFAVNKLINDTSSNLICVSKICYNRKNFRLTSTRDVWVVVIFTRIIHHKNINSVHISMNILI